MILLYYNNQGRPQDLGGEGQELFFGALEFACCFAAHGFVMRFASGVRGHAPPRNFFLNGAIWCVLVYIWIKF